jgi:hypothetical protein
MFFDSMRSSGKGAEGVGRLGCEVRLVIQKAKTGTCTNLKQLCTGARAGPVPFLPHESIGTSSVHVVLMGQFQILSWLPHACF